MKQSKLVIAKKNFAYTENPKCWEKQKVYWVRWEVKKIKIKKNYAIAENCFRHVIFRKFSSFISEHKLE